MSKLWKLFTISLAAVLLFVPLAAGQQPNASGPQISARVGHVSPAWDHWGPGYYFGGPNQGTLRIKSERKYAFVFVDGQYCGLAREIGRLTLLPGTHFVELRDIEGVILFRQRVNIKIGRLSTVDFRS